MIGLPVGRFLREVLLNEFLVVLVAMTAGWGLSRVLPLDTWWGFLVHAFCSLALTGLTIWLLGFSRKERQDWAGRIFARHD